MGTKARASIVKAIIAGQRTISWKGALEGSDVLLYSLKYRETKSKPII